MIEQKKFLINQAIASSIIAAFQHAGVYVAGLKANDPRKNNLRKELADRLRSLGEKYQEPVTGEEHCRNIEDLADSLTKRYKGTGLLRNDRFRIGIAQKALNVYLKTSGVLRRSRRHRLIALSIGKSLTSSTRKLDAPNTTGRNWTTSKSTRNSSACARRKREKKDSRTSRSGNWKSMQARFAILPTPPHGGENSDSS